MSSADNPRPFFILGSPRSGTSLLSRMLGSHENIVVPPESLLFKMFWSFREKYGDLTRTENQVKLLEDMLATRVIGYWSPKPCLDEVLPFLRNPGFGGVVEALILSSDGNKEVLLWGEKSPGHVFYWRAIKECFPDARVIHIVRDGRDVATSLLEARMGPKTYDAAARLWKSYLSEMDRVRASCPPEHYCEIHYESLLENPEATLGKVCASLGVDYSPGMLRFFENKSPYRTDSTNAANLQKPVIVSNREKWRKKMNRSQLREFETVARQQLTQCGYAPGGDGQPLSRRRQAYIRYFHSPIVRFIARARDRQGQLEFLNLNAIKLRRVIRRYTSMK